LIKLFSKVCESRAELSSPTAVGEIPLTAFLFVNFFFAPSACKEKVGKQFYVASSRRLLHRCRRCVLLSFFGDAVPHPAKNPLKRVLGTPKLLKIGVMYPTAPSACRLPIKISPIPHSCKHDSILAVFFLPDLRSGGGGDTIELSVKCILKH